MVIAAGIIFLCIWFYSLFEPRAHNMGRQAILNMFTDDAKWGEFITRVEVYVVTKWNWDDPVLYALVLGAVHRYGDPGMLRLKNVWDSKDQLVATWLPLHLLKVYIVVYANDIAIEFMRSPFHQVRRERCLVTLRRLEVSVAAVEDLTRIIMLQQNASVNSFGGRDRVLYHAPVPRGMYPLVSHTRCK
jgi:hypothetical protein